MLLVPTLVPLGINAQICWCLDGVFDSPLSVSPLEHQEPGVHHGSDAEKAP